MADRSKLLPVWQLLEKQGDGIAERTVAAAAAAAGRLRAWPPLRRRTRRMRAALHLGLPIQCTLSDTDCICSRHMCICHARVEA